ncbi:spermidine synthase [Bradyrhizobium sp. AC87j1]|nr:spermidine synthase [Bradyrhizobium sp. AC87j1]
MVCGLLFFSGGAALIYQVLWIKQLSLVVGAEVHAISIAISGFFGGLALGSWLFGRWADRSGQPVRLYAFLELGTAIAGIAATLALANAGPVFVRLEAISQVLAWASVFVLIAVPAFMMGGTLPVLVRSLTGWQDAGDVGGRFYAANTAGAIMGALLPVFLLIPLFGIRGSAIFATALNSVAAIGAFLLDRSMRRQDVAAANSPSQRSNPATARWAVALYAAAGGIALGYEIVWSQAVIPLMSTRSFAFSIVLATYLAGIALGAALFARLGGRVKDTGAAFGLLIASAGWLALVEIAAYGPWLIVAQTVFETATYRITGSDLAGMSARFVATALCIVLAPTLLLGAAFPAALKLVVGDGKVGRDVGVVVAANTLGGIAGTLVTGFVLIPRFGLVRTLGILAVAAAVVGAIAAISFVSSSRSRWAIFAVGLASVFVAVLTPSEQIIRLTARGGDITFYDEGAAGTVSVVETSSAGRSFHRLYIQGVSNSGDAMPSLRYMRLQALLPLIIHNGDPKSALVIGYGTGITAGALSQFPGLERRVVSELLPAVLRAAPNFKGTFDAGTDPGLEKRLRDGRRELLSSEQRYDLITLEPPPPSAAGVVNLYSSDFYRLSASRLNDKGIVAQWLPLPTQNEEDTRALVRSFIDVFPNASLWSTELHETLLVGSLLPIELDVARISERLRRDPTSKALADVGVNSPAALLATWVTDREGLARFAGDASAVTDNRPSIEYATWVRRGEFARTFARLQELKGDPPIANAASDFVPLLAVESEELRSFYRLALSALAGDRATYARDVERTRDAARKNPYYRWFVGAKVPP